MIGRIWHGTVPVGKSDAYLKKMRIVALPGYRGVDGNRGAWVMHRIEDDIAHFDMLTFWDDVDAIKRFAGEDYAKSQYFDFDDDFLIEKEPRVRHWEMYDDLASKRLPMAPNGSVGPLRREFAVPLITNVKFSEATPASHCGIYFSTPSTSAAKALFSGRLLG